MIQVQTWFGEGSSFDEALSQAEEEANKFLKELKPEDVIRVTAQTATTPYKQYHSTDTDTIIHIYYTHVITIIYRTKEE
jgi:hypothetical protein